MTDFEGRMAQAKERIKQRREQLEAEAKSRGVEDIEGYVKAIIELENGPFQDGAPD